MRNYMSFQTVSIQLVGSGAPNFVFAAFDKEEARMKYETWVVTLTGLGYTCKRDYERRDYLLMDKRNVVDLIDAWTLGNWYRSIDWTRYEYPWFYFPDSGSHNKGANRKSPRCYWSRDCPGKGKAPYHIFGDTSRIA